MKYLFLLFILFINIVNAQDESKTVADTLVKGKQVIPIGEISSRNEALFLRFVELREEIKPSSEISATDTILDATLNMLIQEKELIYSDSSDQSYRSIQAELREWKEYEKQLDEIQKHIKSRSDQIEEISDELNNYLSNWQETKDEGIENKASKEVIESIDRVIETINTIIITTNARSDSIFLIQKKLTDEILIVDDVIHEIILREKNLQSNYFVTDSPEIWNAMDSLSTYSVIKAKVRDGLNHDATTLMDYLSVNRTSLFWQILFLIVLLVLFFYLKRKSIKKENRLKYVVDETTYQILSNPISSVIVSGLLITSFFFRNNPPVMGELNILIILSATAYLLPKLTVKRLSLLLFLLLFIIVINLAGNYVGIKTFSTRIVTIISAVLLIYILFDFRINKSFKQYFNIKWGGLVSASIYLFIILAVFGLIANIIGSVNLSDFILTGVMFSSVFAAIIWVAIKVYVSIILLLSEKDVNQKSQTLSSFNSLLHKWIKPVLNWSGFLFWIYLTLIAFSIIKYAKTLFSDLMDIKWQVGELTISLGGIISFLIILIVTLIITRLISGILKDEWIDNTGLPKGSSGAISIVLRIIVTTLGLYFAAAAAGINLSQFGFILGALSVGIGFGLQSIVLNFIAGLILAFERPIHIGDKIEVDMEFGIVSEIGIRASKLKTWDGTEVIIPNGDLVSKKVVNYTLSDEKRRMKIPIRTAMDSVPKQVIEILTTVANNHPNTFKDPKPKTYFQGYGETSLDFVLYYWTFFDVGLSTRNAILLEIHDALLDAGIKLPIPVRRLEIDNKDDNIPGSS
jgi:small-conductance mechanosensitive channel